MAWRTPYQYPGDPVAEVTLMFGGEFAVANPNREIVITGGSPSEVQRIPIEDIICDSCNAAVAHAEPCAVTEHRLYCWDCYIKWVQPYLHGEGHALLQVGGI